VRHQDAGRFPEKVTNLAHGLENVPSNKQTRRDAIGSTASFNREVFKMVKPTKKANHPWVMAAFFCNQSLEESNNVLSAIRIVDTFTITRPPGSGRRPTLQLPLHALVCFKSGDVEGERKVRIFTVSPSGKRKKSYEVSVVFMGGDSGVNLRLNIGFRFKAGGTYWMEVYVGSWLATRMPLTIRIVKAPKIQTPAESPPQSTEMKNTPTP
jgi:hypothetical protein